MSDLDLELREKYNIPDEKDTMEWCEENGIDYQEELIRIYISDEIHETAKQFRQKRSELQT